MTKATHGIFRISMKFKFSKMLDGTNLPSSHDIPQMNRTEFPNKNALDI